MRAAGLDDFLREPVGKWVVVGTTVMWCHSRVLFGTASWGRPGEAETRQVVGVWKGMEHLAQRFEVVFDVSGVEHVDPGAIAVLVEWGRTHLDELQRRLHTCVGVVPRGIHGVTMAGISAAVGGSWPVRIVEDVGEGFGLLALTPGEEVCDEVAAIVEGVRGVAPILVRLRRLLDDGPQPIELAEAARRLTISTRSLQRQLLACGTSYRREVSAARFRAVEKLLATDEKIASVAARVGLSETGLTLLARSHTGMSPAEWRRRRGR